KKQLAREKLVEKIGEDRANQSPGIDPSVSITELAGHLHIHKSNAKYRADAAIALGYIENRQWKSGLPAELVVGEPLPNDHGVLPDPNTVAAAWRCGVAPLRGEAHGHYAPDEGTGRDHRTDSTVNGDVTLDLAREHAGESGAARVGDGPSGGAKWN